RRKRSAHAFAADVLTPRTHAHARDLRLHRHGRRRRPSTRTRDGRQRLPRLHRRAEIARATCERPRLTRVLRAQWRVRCNRDFALFSLGRHPDSAKGRLRAERMAERLHAQLDGRRMTDRDVGRALGVGNALRYAATTGTVAIRWEGARAPTVWTVAAAKVDP